MRILYDKNGVPFHRWKIIEAETESGIHYVLDWYDTERNAMLAAVKMGWDFSIANHILGRSCNETS